MEGPIRWRDRQKVRQMDGGTDWMPPPTLMGRGEPAPSWCGHNSFAASAWGRLGAIKI